MAGLRKLIPLQRLFVLYSLPLILVICSLAVFDVLRRPDRFFLD